jgi:hypothetical protein
VRSAEIKVAPERTPPLVNDDHLAWTREPDKLPPIRLSWKGVVSAPLQQAPESFRYLVHASWIDTRHTFQKTVDHLAKDNFTSASLVFPGHVNTFYAPMGFVIRTSPESVIGSSATDMGTFAGGRTREQVRASTLLNHGLSTPAKLMKESETVREGQWNEVLLENKGPNTIRPVAIFVVTDQDGRPEVSQKQLDLITTLSREKGLPIIKLPRSSPHAP